jgi:hypothetical protein
MFVATFLGYTVAKIIDPILIALALLFGLKLENRFPILLLSVAYGLINWLFFTSFSGTKGMMTAAACVAASLFWFFLVYEITQFYRRKKQRVSTIEFE